jgi:hypothetical protein
MAFYDMNGTALVGYTQGLQPFQSLNAVSALGAGAALDAVTCRGNVVATVTASAGTTAGQVTIQGSLDHVNWVTVGSPVTTSAAGTTAVTATGQFYRYIRANVTTTIVGGTVTVSVGSNG